MTAVLILLLFIILFVAYYSMTRSFVSPFSLLLVSFIMALSIIVSNTDNWQVSLNSRFILYILIAAGSFGLGCAIANSLSGPQILGAGDKCVIPNNTRIDSKLTNLVLVICSLACTAVYVFLSIRIGISNGNASIFRSIYEASAENSSNFVLHQFREIVVALAEISLLIVFKCKYIDKKRFPWLLLVPSICFFVSAMFSADRNIFIRFIIFALCLWIFFYSSTSSRTVSTTNRKILRNTIVIVVVAALLFFMLGKIKSYTSNLERMIGIYGGSGLYNFNLSLDEIDRADLQYGQQTFSQLLKLFDRMLEIFGITVSESTNDLGIQMVVFLSPNGYVYASNIYSSMTPYMIDFGVLGLFIFPAVMGFIFKSLYSAAVKRGSFFLWGLYAMMVYSVVYFTIGEQFFMRFHLGLVYELFWYSFIYFLVFGNRTVRVKYSILL